VQCFHDYRLGFLAFLLLAFFLGLPLLSRIVGLPLLSRIVIRQAWHGLLKRFKLKAGLCLDCQHRAVTRARIAGRSSTVASYPHPILGSRSTRGCR
jgi:hypothetical protein